MARLYTNENFPLPVAAVLRELGHDVLTIQEAGKASQAITDEEVLDYARGQGRVLVTLNRRHFIRLHRSHPEHAGIVICTFDPDFAGLAARIDQELNDEHRLPGAMIRVQRPAR